MYNILICCYNDNNSEKGFIFVWSAFPLKSLMVWSLFLKLIFFVVVSVWYLFFFHFITNCHLFTMNKVFSFSLKTVISSMLCFNSRFVYNSFENVWYAQGVAFYIFHIGPHSDLSVNKIFSEVIFKIYVTDTSRRVVANYGQHLWLITLLNSTVRNRR